MELDLSQSLQQHFGYGGFRKGQEAVVRSVLSGRPTIAILPTGAGKSLCFQLPALLLEGTTVVVSPLVALMKDQVDALRARGIAATFINSSLTDAERQERQAALRRGEYRLVYVAPERFKSPSFLSAMSGIKVPLLAVDEAHCISAWGHDFRPEYQKIAQARASLGAERILALTATATPEVRRDIAEALELRGPNVFVAGFDRPNLFIEVLPVSGDTDKLGRLLALARRGGPGIIYAATRKNVDKVVAALKAGGIEAAGYHAGMQDDDRGAVQDRFLRGELRVIVATNAFGMGVDKADIRFVAHFDVPRSLEAYYQEIGRAGRDGEPSLALLLFNFADVMMQRRMIDSGRPSRDLVATAWEAARKLRTGSVEELARACNVSASELSGAVRLLESAGHLERGRGRSSQFAVVTPSVAAADLAVDFELLELRVARERQMLDRLVRFADTRGCRRQNLLRYFGDQEAPRGCSACESCVGSRAPEPEKVSPRKKDRAAKSETGHPAAVEAPFDARVFEELRALRIELARELHVPPYIIFHDSTLRELSRALPRDERGFLAVKGAGPSRWQRYGERVVAITGKPRPPLPEVAQPTNPEVATRSGTEPAAALELGMQPSAVQDEGLFAPLPALQEPPPMVREEIEVPGRPPAWVDAGPPPWEETRAKAAPRGSDEVWALCSSGATLAEICQRLRRTGADVASQLADGARQGRSVDAVRLLGRERVEAIRSAAASSGGDLVAVRKRLTFTAALAEIRLALVAT